MGRNEARSGNMPAGDLRVWGSLGNSCVQTAGEGVSNFFVGKKIYLFLGLPGVTFGRHNQIGDVSSTFCRAEDL